MSKASTIDYRVRLLALPFRRPIESPHYRFTDLFVLLCEASDGEGTGMTGLWFAKAEQADVVLEAMRYAAPIACRTRQPTELSRALRKEMNFLGYKGVTVIAMSGFEMALQDLLTLRAGISIGGRAVRRRVPVYWSGFFLNDSLDSWLKEAAWALDHGFSAFKARVGRDRLQEDLDRVAALRRALPPDAILMIDPNQAWDVATATEASRRLADHEIKWLEDPVVHNDYHGLAEVARNSPIPIATGENEYLHEGFAQLVGVGVQYLLADLQRAGGFLEWQEIAALARRAGVVLTPHLYPHVAVRLCSTLQQDEVWLEYVDWWDPLMAEQLAISSGEAVVPTSPGSGFVADPQAIERFAMSKWEELTCE